MPNTMIDRTIAVTTCPTWCDRAPAMHPDDEGVTTHQHLVGNLGVAIEQCRNESVRVYVPQLDRQPDMSASPAFARQLGADLIAAANVLGVSA